jgi:uncharacterized protein GlcG (DUF336 family)
MPPVILAQVSTLVDAVLARAGELGQALLTVAVLDPGGHLVVLVANSRGQLSAARAIAPVSGPAWEITAPSGAQMPDRPAARS